MGAKRHLYGSTQEGTYRQTHGYRNSMTESAQWADSVKIFSKDSDHDMQILCRRDAVDEFLLETRYHHCLTTIHAHNLTKLYSIWGLHRLKRCII